MKINNKEYYIWLLSVMGAANPRTMRLISRFGGIEEVYNALTSGETNINSALKPYEVKALKASSLDKSRELIEWCDKRGYGIVTIDDTDYPEPLKHIYNPPILLFTEGDIAGINDGIRINVIGTRNPSDYSYRVASIICGELAKIGITIVSGMAVGLDKCAMTAAIENGGKVAGVLACGIDVEYPRGSKTFRKGVANAGVVFISELMPRDSTRPTYFQYRNRIMSGLSSGTLIVEAGEISGCHITALHAISQNRDLFCIPPHDILDQRYSGVVRYLRDGAIPVFGHIDIVNEYLSDLCVFKEDGVKSAEPKAFEKSLVPAKKPSKSTKATKAVKAVKAAETPNQQEKQQQQEENNTEIHTIVFKDKNPIPQTPPKADYSQLPEGQKAIIDALLKKKLTFDEIVRKKLCTADSAFEILLDMELDGLIEKISGDRYAVMK